VLIRGGPAVLLAVPVDVNLESLVVLDNVEWVDSDAVASPKAAPAPVSWGLYWLACSVLTRLCGFSYLRDWWLDTGWLGRPLRASLSLSRWLSSIVRTGPALHLLGVARPGVGFDPKWFRRTRSFHKRPLKVPPANGLLPLLGGVDDRWVDLGYTGRFLRFRRPVSLARPMGPFSTEPGWLTTRGLI
jgi:hypothetical protein